MFRCVSIYSSLCFSVNLKGNEYTLSHSLYPFSVSLSLLVISLHGQASIGNDVSDTEPANVKGKANDFSRYSWQSGHHVLCQSEYVQYENAVALL